MALIKRFGVLRMACFMGLYGVFIGLIFAIIQLIFIAIFASVVSQLGTTTQIGLFGGSTALILLTFPILYGIISFIAGLIFTPIMNLILKIIGGLELDISMQSAAPRA